jgi:predicted nucleotidyltransferase
MVSMRLGPADPCVQTTRNVFDKNKKYSKIIDMDLEQIPEKYQEDIKKARNLLKNEGCKVVYLFGSMVTGKIHKNSDIDIGISGLPPQKFFKVYAHLDKELSNKVDLVDFDFQKDFYDLLNSLGEVVELG